MAMDGEIIRREDFYNASYFSSFEDKYIIFDNLDRKDEPTIKQKNIPNNMYVYVIVVLHGTLNLMVNSTELHIRSNEYLTVMPCTNIYIKDSRCIFFTYATRGYLIETIYKQMGMLRDSHTHCYTFHHHHFSHEQTIKFKSIYLRTKREHERPNYFMKEFALRAMLMAYYSQLHTFLKDNKEINHNKNTRQEQTFKQFLDLLDANYTKERSVTFYANKLNITTKYLSTTTMAFTGLPASKIIDNIIAFQIKQLLYTNSKNIKEISNNLNFKSQSFLGRYFKRVTGMTPKEYINKYSIEHV